MNHQELEELHNRQLLEVACIKNMLAKAKTHDTRTKLERNLKTAKQTAHATLLRKHAVHKAERESHAAAQNPTRKEHAVSYEQHFLDVAKEYMTHGQLAAARIEASRRADGLPGEMSPPVWVVASKKIRTLALRLSTKLGKKAEA